MHVDLAPTAPTHRNRMMLVGAAVMFAAAAWYLRHPADPEQEMIRKAALAHHAAAQNPPAPVQPATDPNNSMSDVENSGPSPTQPEDQPIARRRPISARAAATP